MHKEGMRIKLFSMQIISPNYPNLLHINDTRQLSILFVASCMKLLCSEERRKEKKREGYRKVTYLKVINIKQFLWEI